MRPFTGIAALVLSLGVVACVFPTGGPAPSPAPLGSTPTVTLTPNTQNQPVCVTVVPPVAVGDLNQPVIFQVASSVPASYKIEIDLFYAEGLNTSQRFEWVKGPFPAQAPSAEHPRRGRFFLQQQSVTTASADHIGYWKYEIALVNDQGFLFPGCEAQDPGIIIKN